eukprot:7376091-Prymnesium_polylepis.1
MHEATRGEKFRARVQPQDNARIKLEEEVLKVDEPLHHFSFHAGRRVHLSACTREQGGHAPLVNLPRVVSCLLLRGHSRRILQPFSSERRFCSANGVVGCPSARRRRRNSNLFSGSGW